VNLDPPQGREIGKVRPALVVSRNTGNQHSPYVTVAPISSSSTEYVTAFEVLLKRGEGGGDRDRKVLLNLMRAVDWRTRFIAYQGFLSDSRMREVEDAIRVALDLPAYATSP